MLLTLFYMITTTIQAWRLSSLRSRLFTLLQGSNYPYPSIMLYTNPGVHTNEDTSTGNEPISSQNFMTSHLCSNKGLAKLGDLLWCQGDTTLCSIHPQQEVNISDWLAFRYGHTVFPLYVHNCGQPSLSQDLKMHILIEADFDNYRPLASTLPIKLEDYGLIITWTADKHFNLIIETDLDCLNKFIIAVMQGQCFINNGLLLTRIESVLISGKPCVYDSDRLNLPPDKRLISKTNWEAYIKNLRILSSTARLASQQDIPIEIPELQSVLIFPSSKAFNLQTAKIPECVLPNENDEKEDVKNFSVPSTPPSTPTPININPTKESENLFSQVTVNPSNMSNEDSNVPNKMTNNLRDLKINLEADTKKLNRKESQSTVTLTSTSNSSSFFPSKSSHSTPSKNDKRQVNIKPPNIFIYADSAVVLNNVKTVLQLSLKSDLYIIYTLTLDQARTDKWMDQASLVVVCGNVGNEIGTQLVEYIVRGGKLLALCSDTLHTFLPSFKTAEVREHELVRFSYGKWKHVRMMHHIFCYQASPVKTKFSQDHEDVKISKPQPPVSATVKDKLGKLHSFDVEVLGVEETWHTPSILLANLSDGGGKVVFSQIHLEADPTQYEFEESIFNALKQSDKARLEIFNDLLSTHLEMQIKKDDSTQDFIKYGSGFFLGRHELKLEVLKNLKRIMQSDDLLKLPNLEIQFCGRNTKMRSPSSSLLPVMIHQCPDNFSTIEYFENLKTKDLGRLVIYTDIITTSMDVIAGCKLQHGLTVISRKQTRGKGRSGNTWISPDGCAMFSMQLHIDKNSQIGNHISILQHIISVAIITAITSLDGYQNINLKLKWPNDIYNGDQIKIGGVIVATQVEASHYICNIGVGVNLSNSTPTRCINDSIASYTKEHKTKLPFLTYERYLALVFTELEKLYDIVQSGDTATFLNMYYKLWMHKDANIKIQSAEGKTVDVKILGIDEYGFLRVQDAENKIFSVQPDGNTFDILQGLIAPK